MIATIVVVIGQMGCGQSDRTLQQTESSSAANRNLADSNRVLPDVANQAFTLMMPGQTAPPYEVRTLSGAVERIGSEQPVTLLNLWATWCAPCRAEFPDLEKLHRKLERVGFRLLAVDIDSEPSATLQTIANDLDLTLTIARDTAGEIQQFYPAIGVPTSFLLSKSGALVRSWTGVIPEDEYHFIEQYALSESSD